MAVIDTEAVLSAELPMPTARSLYTCPVAISLTDTTEKRHGRVSMDHLLHGGTGDWFWSVDLHKRRCVEVRNGITPCGSRPEDGRVCEINFRGDTHASFRVMNDS